MRGLAGRRQGGGSERREPYTTDLHCRRNCLDSPRQTGQDHPGEQTGLVNLTACYSQIQENQYWFL